MLIGYARVSKADGSQSLELQGDALWAEPVRWPCPRRSSDWSLGSPRPKTPSSGSPIHPWRYSYLWVYRGAIREGCHMPRHPDTVTVGVPMGADLLHRLDAVASDLGMNRPEAIHTALLHWLEQEERKTAVRNRMLRVRAWPKTDVRTA